MSSPVEPQAQTLLALFNREKQRPFVWLVLVLSCIPFILYMMNGLTALSAWFMPQSASQLLHVSSVWKLWSPTFIHYTLLHLFTNLVLWWMFAGKVERESRKQLLIIFMISAAMGNLWQWGVTGVNFGGLSGVIYALMGYLSVLNLYYGKAAYHVDRGLIVLMLALIPLSMLDIFANLLGKTSDYAHLGGLLSGIVLAFIYAFLKQLPPVKFTCFNQSN
jgi:GlpG protein